MWNHYLFSDIKANNHGILTNEIIFSQGKEINAIDIRTEKLIFKKNSINSVFNESVFSEQSNQKNPLPLEYIEDVFIYI